MPELISDVINAALGILAAITVVVLVISGFRYMISSNLGEIAQATQGITNAIVGLIIIVGAFLITDYVISALVS
ncbi:pilin [Picosynechococcus sp. NKBG042902]|uniref:pilin n=1 Tax=Picosynechococcus sp. NKBG042902 TaxID=490193 RepID=UPI002110D841|nr:pilin [Picosynechococcus sp. NKBG042902]